MILQVFALTNGTRALTIPYSIPLQMGCSLLIGCGISLVVNLLVWPETAVDGLGRALRDTMTSSKDMLDMITKQFFLEPGVDMIPSKTIDDTAEKMRNCLTKVRSAYKEAKYEISYTRIRPTELISIRRSLERIIKHLSALSRGLQSERELFDSILASVENDSNHDDEEYDSDDDNGDSEGDISTHLSPSDNDDNDGYQKKVVDSTTPLSVVDEAPFMTRVTTTENDNHLSPKAAQLLRSSAPPAPGAINNLKTAYTKHYKSNSTTIPQTLYGEADDENEDDDNNADRNQLSVSSFKSFLHIPKRLSPSMQKQPVATPQKRRKALHSRKDQNLLFTYLESLREPLTQLSIRCVDALVCVRDGISRAIINDSKPTNGDDDSNMGDTLWLSFLFSDCCHKNKNKNKFTDKNVHDEKRTSNKTASSSRSQRRPRPHDVDHCTCSDDMIQALRKFDADEKESIRSLYDHNKRLSTTSQNEEEEEDPPLDLTIREELFMVFFFIFTIREICKELAVMTRNMNELKERCKKNPRRLYIPRPTLRWLRKWLNSNNHQSTRDKGGHSPGTLIRDTKDEEHTNKATDEYRLVALQEQNIKRFKSRKGSATVVSSTQRMELIKSRASTKRSAASSSDHSLRSQSDRISNVRKRGRHIDHPPRRDSVLLMDIENQLAAPQRWNENENEGNNGEAGSDSDDDTISQQRSRKSEQPKTPLIIKLRYQIWCILHYLTKYEVKFAIKTAAAVTSLCIPAFVPASNGWYIRDRGQWASITVIAIMNPTSGGTLHAGLWRVAGTLIGGLIGWAALESDNGRAYFLALFAVLLAIPFFYVHLGSTYNKVGTVVLITYVAVALTRYVKPPDNNESISTTVWKRIVTVIIGIIVATFLNSAVWPFIARHATRQSVSSIANRLGEYYNFLTGTFLYHDLSIPPSEDDIRRCTQMEQKIQSSINSTSVLLELTDHEPRLKGPFPKEIYREMINSTQAILDNLGSIRVALLQMPWIVKLDICNQHHYKYRRDMVASLMLHFYTISSSLASKVPLPVYLPSMRAARKRILDRRRNEEEGGDRWVKFNNLSWYCMAFSSAEIVDELEHLTKLVRFIVGEARYSDRAKHLDEELIPNQQY
ncbi:Fusaric acid resistance protein-like-domain-containing protein [Circinella umbellata]|nr:Fusaric acid resistance protein-like-domain-containing protein [Circinella umbellata]